MLTITSIFEETLDERGTVGEPLLMTTGASGTVILALLMGRGEGALMVVAIAFRCGRRTMQLSVRARGRTAVQNFENVKMDVSRRMHMHTGSLIIKK